MASLIAQHLLLEGDRKSTFIEERQVQDMILGLLLLKTDFWELKWLDFLPQLLDDFGLVSSWMAILYALGYEDHLRTEEVIPPDLDQAAVRDFFGKWLRQPAKDDLPDKPELLLQSDVTLRSFVLGCEVTVTAANNLTSMQFAETLLGALEALLATSLERGVLPYRSAFHVSIKPSEFISGLPEYQINEVQGISELQIRHAAVLSHLTIDEQKAFRQQLLEIIMQTICQIAVIRNMESYFDRIGGDELGFGRALDFTDVSTCVENILGDRPKFHLTDWRAEGSGTYFPPQRKFPWNDGLNERNTEIDTTPTTAKPGTGEPPEELLDVESLQHRDRRIVSFINVPLWDRAGWTAAVYLYSEDPNGVPGLVLGFKDADAAQAIFREWRARLGQSDIHEQLRVSVITAVNKAHPAWYTLVIGANLPVEHGNAQHGQLLVVSQPHRMTPSNSHNLDNFLAQFGRSRRFILMPAHFIQPSIPPRLFPELGIGKRQLHVCPARQLRENDPELCVISPDDDPVIPEGIGEPPVLRAIQERKNRQARKS